LALGEKELPELPESKTVILEQADRLDTEAFTRSIIREVQCDFVLRGSATAELEVQTRPTETLIRQGEE
jgi:hypothetical protein